MKTNLLALCLILSLLSKVAVAADSIVLFNLENEEEYGPFELVNGEIIEVEDVELKLILEEESEAREHAEAAVRGHQRFETSQVLDVCSPRGIWRRCAIVEVEPAPHESVLVHYHGFSDEFDEWIPAVAWPTRLRWAPRAVHDSPRHAATAEGLPGAELRTLQRGDGASAQCMRIETQAEMIARLRSTANVASMRSAAEKRWAQRY